jgi:hypothetical protein
MGCFPKFITCVLCAARLLALAKPLNGIKCLQWARSSIGWSIKLYVFNFEMPSFLICHLINLAIKDKCEGVVDGIRTTLDVCPCWVVLQVDVMDAFNSISQKAIF